MSWPLLIILLYLILINLVIFLAFGVDKWRAGKNIRRTPEKFLWLLIFFGGSIGAIAGMSFFRHKTRKISFQFIVALIVLGQMVLLALIWFYFFRDPARWQIFL